MTFCSSGYFKGPSWFYKSFPKLSFLAQLGKKVKKIFGKTKVNEDIFNTTKKKGIEKHFSPFLSLKSKFLWLDLAFYQIINKGTLKLWWSEMIRFSKVTGEHLLPCLYEENLRLGLATVTLTLLPAMWTPSTSCRASWSKTTNICPSSGNTNWEVP